MKEKDREANLEFELFNLRSILPWTEKENKISGDHHEEIVEEEYDDDDDDDDDNDDDYGDNDNDDGINRL